MTLERYTRATLLATLASALTILSFLPNRDSYAQDSRTVARVGAEDIKPASGWHIFLVGVGDYDSLAALGGPVNDVEALEQRFIELGVAPENIVTMKSRSRVTRLFPERDRIAREYKNFLKALGPNDFAIVYLSGHGKTDNKRSYFAPADCDPAEIKTYLSIDEMMQEFESSKALYRLMIVDACRGSDDKSGETDKTHIATDNVPDSVTLLQSCSAGESSWDIQRGDTKNGVFALTLLEALDVKNCPAYVDENGDLTFDAVFDYVSKETNDRATRVYGKSQTPSRTVKRDRRFVMISGVRDSKRKQAETLYEEASKLDSEGDARAKKDDRQNAVKSYAAALSKLETALYLFPQDERYVALRKKVAEKLNGMISGVREKRKQAEALYEEASKLDAEGDARAASAKKDVRQNAVKSYAAALSKLETALFLFPQDERYVALRKKVDEKLNGAPPVTPGEEEYKKAVEAFDEKDYATAQNRIGKARERDRYNERYISLERTIQAAIDDSKPKPKPETETQPQVTTTSTQPTSGSSRNNASGSAVSSNGGKESPHVAAVSEPTEVPRWKNALFGLVLCAAGLGLRAAVEKFGCIGVLLIVVGLVRFIFYLFVN